ncbi:MAG: TrkH family potassium uptake protein [Planctomycetota bacterium]
MGKPARTTRTGPPLASPPVGIRRVMDVVLALAGVAGAAALAMEYGFRDRPLPRAHLHVIESAVVVVFSLDRLLRVALAPRKRAYLADNWIDFALILVAAAALLVAGYVRGDIVSLGALYVIITQGYILLSLIIRAVNVNLQVAGSGIPPMWLLMGSFAAMCLIGSALLMLPVATAPGTQRWFYTDALFTAVSATCVTGLIVADTGTHFTYFGQGVILVLIQLGGLGIMMFGTMLAMLVGKGLSLRHSETIGQMLATERRGDLGRTLKFVALLTFALEVVGAALLYPMYRGALDGFGEPMGDLRAAWHAVFHSVSSFCNAGFALYRANMMHGVRAGWAHPLRQSWQVLTVMGPLIILGGLGFPVLHDSWRWGASRLRRVAARLAGRRRRYAERGIARLALHSKIVLITTAALLAVGAVGLVAIEKLPAGAAGVGRHPIGGQEARHRAGHDPTALADLRGAALARAAAFQSLTARTAGFNTVDMDRLSGAGKLWMSLLMFVGGSPASTAGGMKTTTFALLVLATWCLIRRRSELEVLHRSISADLLRRTAAIAVLYTLLVATVTLLLAAVLKDRPFVNVLFEACSACGTVGLSTGITGPDCTIGDFPKIVIIVGMFAGRLGPLTLLLAVTSHVRPVRYNYPEENVVIG